MRATGRARWFHDLYQIGSVSGVKAVVLRVALAVGIPLIGSVLAGHPAAGVAFRLAAITGARRAELCALVCTDLDGDRLTDLMADAPDMLRGWGQKILDHVKAGSPEMAIYTQEALDEIVKRGNEQIERFQKANKG